MVDLAWLIMLARGLFKCIKVRLNKAAMHVQMLIDQQIQCTIMLYKGRAGGSRDCSYPDVATPRDFQCWGQSSDAFLHISQSNISVCSAFPCRLLPSFLHTDSIFFPSTQYRTNFYCYDSYLQLLQSSQAFFTLLFSVFCAFIQRKSPVV
jgi:hypothetical protein